VGAISVSRLSERVAGGQERKSIKHHQPTREGKEELRGPGRAIGESDLKPTEKKGKYLLVRRAGEIEEGKIAQSGLKRHYNFLSRKPERRLREGEIQLIKRRN